MALIDLTVIGLIGIVLFLLLQGHRRGTGSATAEPIDAETRHLREEVSELRARIQVLERVITDNHGAADLTKEIDRLRDR